MLGLNKSSVLERIARIPELAALYGNRSEDADLPPAPDVLDVQLREPGDAPDSITDQQKKDAEMVKQTERLIHEGLEKVGVPKETLDKIRTLRGLNVSGGMVIAQSVSDIYQLYYIELMCIPARRAEIRRKYLEDEPPKDGETKAVLTPMERMFWQKADTELFEQMGKGLDRFISGTQVLLAMERGRKGHPTGSKKEKPAY